MTGMLNLKLKDPEYRARHELRYPFVVLENQILIAMEDKGWTYEDLAKAVGTSKQNIWRDLKNGGLHKASLDRVGRIAQALGLHMHPFLFTAKQAKKILPVINKALAA